MKTLISDSNHLSYNSSKNPDLHNWNDWAYKLGILLDDVITTDGLTNAQRLELAIKEFVKLKEWTNKLNLSDNTIKTNATTIVNNHITSVIQSDDINNALNDLILTIINDSTLGIFGDIGLDTALSAIAYNFRKMFELTIVLERKLNIKFDDSVLKHSNIFNVNGTTVKNLIELLKENIIK